MRGSIPLIRYLWSIPLLALSVALVLVSPTLLGPYIVLIFLAGVVVTARLGGLGPGLAAIPLSIAAAMYFVIRPGHLLPAPDGWTGSLMYAGIAVICVWLMARRQRAERELREMNRALEERIANRTQELARSYELLRQSERLAAIGQMVTGLSHESRNALQRSMACVHMLESRVKDQPQLQRLVGELRRAHTDLLSVYQNVQDYARPLRLNCARIEIRRTWRDAWEKLVAREERSAKLLENINGTDTICFADAHQLEQVFRNLMDNAMAACADPVEIRIDCKSFDKGSRPFLLVRLRDNGPGLPAEIRNNAFDPFVTTKTKGTGLGLSIVRRIVEAHGGHVELGPEIDKGFEVIIDLPVKSTD